MNTKEFTRELAQKLAVPQNEATRLLKITIEVVSEALGEGKSVSIQKLGNLSVRKVESRRMFSPKLKKHVMTPPKKTLEFHPSKSLKENMKNIRTP